MRGGKAGSIKVIATASFRHDDKSELDEQAERPKNAEAPAGELERHGRFMEATIR
jgi:hypothetical protein